jgi:hypothetical protein
MTRTYGYVLKYCKMQTPVTEAVAAVRSATTPHPMEMFAPVEHVYRSVDISIHVNRYN